MTVRSRVLALVVLLGVAGLAVPSAVVACSCIERQPLRSYVTDPGTVVVAGSAGPRIGSDVAFEVERWYAGTAPARLVVVVPGDGAMCGVPVVPGQRLIMVASRDPDRPDRLHPNGCAPFAELDTPEGVALVAEADQAFGGAPAPEPSQIPLEGPIGPGGQAVWPILVFAAAAGLGFAALLVVVLLLRRGRAGA